MTVAIENDYFSLKVSDKFSIKVPAGKGVVHLSRHGNTVAVSAMDRPTHDQMIQLAQLPKSDSQLRTEQDVSVLESGGNRITRIDVKVLASERRPLHRECNYMIDGQYGYCHVLVSSGLGAKGVDAVLRDVDEMVRQIRVKASRDS